MNKKGIFLLFVLVVIIAGGVFAEEAAKETASTGSGGHSIKNWISGEVSLLGFGFRYERMLTENISVGGTIFWHSFLFFWNSLGITGNVRYYPWGKIFYAEVGLGFGWVSGTDTYTYEYQEWDYSKKRYVTKTDQAEWIYTNSGLMLTPTVGWKIDVGSRGGFYINPMISMPIVFGMKDKWDGKDSEFGVGLNFRPAFGMGYAF